MATVGQPLTAPEAGWRRFEQSDTNITYEGAWTLNYAFAPGSGGSLSYANGKSEIRFNFVGTKIRYIGRSWNTAYSKEIDVYIDDIKVGTFSQNNGTTQSSQILNFEYTGLAQGEHRVRVTNAANALLMDAIDIDSDGIIKPYNIAPAHLIATAGDSDVSLSWDDFADATSYNVKRATISGGEYTTIATGVTSTNFLDSTVTNGTTYYYVVTAINADGESANSNEASAMPAKSTPEPIGNALLRVTMIDSSERQYKISAAVADSFVNWFNHHATTDTASYAIDDAVDDSKEYLVFEKVISFKVIPVRD